MAANLLDDEVLSQMVAGTLPMAFGGGGDPMNSIALVVRDLLGTDAAHMIVAAEKAARKVHYFAVPSAALHSTAAPALPLSAALPGHPAHQGEGCYVMTGVAVSAAAVMRGNELRMFVNEPPLIDALVAETGLPAYDVSALDNGWVMVSRKGELQRSADRASLLAARGAGVVAVVAGLAYGGMLAAEGWLGAGDDKAAATAVPPEVVLRDALKTVQLSTPLSDQLSRVQAVAATAVRAGGWIDMYQLERSREHFRIVMPEWVTRDYVTALGTDVKADLNGDGTIQLVKGSPGRDGKPEGTGRRGGSAAAPAAEAPAAAPAASAPAAPAAKGGKTP